MRAKAAPTIEDLVSSDSLDLYEALQEPKYEEAYRTMRRMIPLDINKSDRNSLSRNLPAKVADRIWSNKILWLICTHPEDIKKVCSTLLYSSTLQLTGFLFTDH
jgi:hypothetical protein